MREILTNILFYLFFLVGGLMSYVIWGLDTNTTIEPSPYCEANQIKEFYRLRTYQFHSGEINAQGYKDSLYKDLQTHFILNK